MGHLIHKEDGSLKDLFHLEQIASGEDGRNDATGREDIRGRKKIS